MVQVCRLGQFAPPTCVHFNSIMPVRVQLSQENQDACFLTVPNGALLFNVPQAFGEPSRIFVCMVFILFREIFHSFGG
jgi:hypothetical protein